jgi:hypothetical protein
MEIIIYNHNQIPTTMANYNKRTVSVAELEDREIIDLTTPVRSPYGIPSPVLVDEMINLTPPPQMEGMILFSPIHFEGVEGDYIEADLLFAGFTPVRLPFALFDADDNEVNLDDLTIVSETTVSLQDAQRSEIGSPGSLTLGSDDTSESSGLSGFLRSLEASSDDDSTIVSDSSDGNVDMEEFHLQLEQEYSQIQGLNCVNRFRCAVEEAEYRLEFVRNRLRIAEAMDSYDSELDI